MCVVHIYGLCCNNYKAISNLLRIRKKRVFEKNKKNGQK